jgi:hypothetical protein
VFKVVAEKSDKGKHPLYVSPCLIKSLLHSKALASKIKRIKTAQGSVCEPDMIIFITKTGGDRQERQAD